MQKILILILAFLSLVGCAIPYDEIGGYANGIDVEGSIEIPQTKIDVPQKTQDVVNFFNVQQDNVNVDFFKTASEYTFTINEYNESGSITLLSDLFRFTSKDSITLKFNIRSNIVDKVKVTFFTEDQILQENSYDVSDEESSISLKYHHSGTTLYNGQVKIEMFKNNDLVNGDASISNLIMQRGYPSLLVSVNQLGYKTNASKVAIFQKGAGESFTVENVDTNEIVYTGKLYGEFDNSDAQEINHYGDFSEVTEVGRYRIYSQTGDCSYVFEIKDEIYDNLLLKSLKFLTLQRCGEELSSEFAGKLAHDICHDSYASIHSTEEMKDVTGGWHDAGDYGRYTITQTKTVNDLLMAYYVYPEMFSDNMESVDADNGIPDVLDEAKVGLEWLKKMQIDWGPMYNAAVTPKFAGTIMPDKDSMPIYILAEENTATASAAGSFALAAIVFKDIDSNKAEEYLFHGKKAYDYAILVRGSQGRSNPTDISAGDYGNLSDADEIFNAAALLYVATHDEVYLGEISHVINNYDYNMSNFAYDSVGGYGIYMLLQDEEFKKHPDYDTLYNHFMRKSTDLVYEQINDGYQMCISSYSWGGNMHVLDRAMSLLLAYEIYEDEDLKASAQAQLDYILGKNAINKSYVTGFGSDYPKNVHHRPSRVSGSLILGAVVGGADGNTGSDLPKAKSYWDTYNSYTTNEVAIYYNSVFVFVVAGLAK